MNIIENNKLIAEFMGFELIGMSHYLCDIDTIIKPTLSPKYMLFSTSFDWLMPVVEKITAIQHDCINPLIGFTIIVNAKANAVLLTPNTTHGPTSLELFGGKLIDSIYKACIHFITWHNENAK